MRKQPRLQVPTSVMFLTWGQVWKLKLMESVAAQMVMGQDALTLLDHCFCNYIDCPFISSSSDGITFKALHNLGLGYLRDCLSHTCHPTLLGHLRGLSFKCHLYKGGDSSEESLPCSGTTSMELLSKGTTPYLMIFLVRAQNILVYICTLFLCFYVLKLMFLFFIYCCDALDIYY